MKMKCVAFSNLLVVMTGRQVVVSAAG